MARKKTEAPSTRDLQGAARLVTDATAGLATLVEAMHARIARFPGRDADAAEADTAGGAERTRGITGLVYKSVRGTTRLVGGSIDVLLSVLSSTLDAREAGLPLGQAQPHADATRHPERDAVMSALNGVLGDYLVSTANPLALGMTMHALGGAPVANAADLTPGPGCNGIVVLLHGLCMNDLQWTRKGHNHGAALQLDLKLLPVYARYNTGLHVSINGRAMARQIEALLTPWPCEVQRLVIVGHSMGGLVARSALHYATQWGLQWPTLLRELIFLGTPHHGSPLERAGNWIDAAMGSTRYSAPLARLGKLRSAGITDLRFGNLVDEDWVGRDRFARSKDRRAHVPLPQDVTCYAVAANASTQDGGVRGRLMGDGLVLLDSAMGRHTDPARTLPFLAEHQWVAQDMNHFDLLSNPEVYAQMLAWLSPKPA